MRTRLTAALVGALLLGSAVPATAASPNWLGRACGKHVTTSCVEDTTGDQILAARALTFHDADGQTLVVDRQGALIRLAHQHSHKCPAKGELRGCYRTEPGIGMAVTLPDGLGIAVKLLRK